MKKILFLILVIINIALLSQYTTTNRRFEGSLTDLYLDCLNAHAEPAKKGECLKELAKYTISTYSIPEINAHMEKITDSDKRMWCHEFMHYSGWALYDKTKNIYDAFNEASFMCDSGMYHGITEQYIKEASLSYSPEEFVEEIIPKACIPSKFSKGAPQGLQYHCYHGLGHAFMFLTQNELNESLKYCDYLSPHFVSACYTGVFMENTLAKSVDVDTSHVSKYSFSEDNPDYPCTLLETKYKDLCYTYKGVHNILTTNVDVVKTMEMCDEVDPLYQRSCYRGAGNNIPGPHTDTVSAAKKCNETKLNPTAYEECIRGSMTFLMQLHLGDSKEAVLYCDTIEESHKDVCYKAAGETIAIWLKDTETMEEKCREFKTIKAQELCLKKTS